jgi:hypothetical protein
MRRLNDREFQAELRRIHKDNDYKEKNKILQEERDKYKKEIKLPSTTKLIAVYLFTMLNVVLIYAMVVMFLFHDLTYLGVLITDIAAQILTFIIYSAKSLKENSKNGITYELAMLEKQNELNGNIDEDVSG